MFKRNKLAFTSLNPIKWLGPSVRLKAARLALSLVAALAITALSRAPAFAQTIDVSKIKAASQAIISSVQAISGIGVTLLLVIGLGLLMWGVALRHAL